ncbi:hypothetical protein ACYOEI_24915 [Singulisphaera rosea]
MATVIKKDVDFRVENRVAIALDALSSDEKRAVNGVLSDRESFLKHAKAGSRVRRISENRPVFAVDILPGLALIYQISGDEVVVIDLMGQGALLRYATKATSRRSVPKEARASIVPKKASGKKPRSSS